MDQAPSTVNYFPELATETSIRLLRIHDHQPDNKVLRCSLELFDLAVSCPQYTAVSYTWGPPFTTNSAVSKEPRSRRAVVCNGQQLELRHNLLDFLNGMEWWAGDLLYMWIDAICICLDRYRTKSCRNLRFERWSWLILNATVLLSDRSRTSASWTPNNAGVYEP